MPNYSFVIDSSFRPFTFQEMYAPIGMYKEEYEKSEAAYNELADKANTFKYLEKVAKDNPKSTAAQIYKGYANELAAQAEDLAKHGLSINNRRALTNLKRRYQGEIGQLEQAREKLKELQKQRNALYAAGKTMLYADDNPDLDAFLGDGENFNRYAIDSDDLYKLGEETGKAISSRMYDVEEGDKVLGGYYRLWKEMKGMPQEKLAAFIQSGAALQLADSLLAQKGALQNLSGANLDNARRAVLNGIANGTIYQESVTPQRDLGVPSWSERRADERAQRSQLVQEAMNGISWKDSKPVYDKNNDIALQKQLEAIREREAAKAAGKTTGGRGSSSEYRTVNKKAVRLEWRGNNPNDLNADADDDMKEPVILKDDEERIGKPVGYDSLPSYMKTKVMDVIGPNGDVDDYEYYYRPYSSGFFGDTEAGLDIVPRSISKHNATSSEAGSMETESMGFGEH